MMARQEGSKAKRQSPIKNAPSIEELQALNRERLHKKKLEKIADLQRRPAYDTFGAEEEDEAPRPSISKEELDRRHKAWKREQKKQAPKEEKVVVKGTQRPEPGLSEDDARKWYRKFVVGSPVKTP